MIPSDRADLEQRLVSLRAQHRSLDETILLEVDRHSDQLTLQRLKKKKLRLRDEITVIENLLIPDNIA